MKATHKLVSKTTGNWWLVCLLNEDTFFYAERGESWSSPVMYAGRDDFYETYGHDFTISKIRTFYGNMYGGVVWAFASKNFHTRVVQTEAYKSFLRKMGVTLGIASRVESMYQTHIKNDLTTSQRLKLRQRRTSSKS